ncbi:hypothetical protein VNO77_02228 [Canavalia gladiata]|uniref:Uncharacterized protein n=1 Tax=Canavalia gladiata TaxID=3824 RepID=A0AAN9R2V1_CANGL
MRVNLARFGAEGRRDARKIIKNEIGDHLRNKIIEVGKRYFEVVKNTKNNLEENREERNKNEEEVFTVKVVLMGGDLVLLKPLEEEDISVLVEDMKKFLDSWMHNIRK